MYGIIRHHLTIYICLLVAIIVQNIGQNQNILENIKRILKNFVLKIVHVIVFDDIIKIEDFDLDNILLDEKSDKNILIYDVSYKTWCKTVAYDKFLPTITKKSKLICMIICL